MLLFTLGYGYYQVSQFDRVVEAAPKLHVGVAEADVGIFQVETRARIRDHLRIQQRLSKQLEERGVDLVVWSESSMRTGGLSRTKRYSHPKTAL